MVWGKKKNEKPVKGSLPGPQYLEEQKLFYLLQGSPLGKQQNLERSVLGRGKKQLSLSNGLLRLKIIICVTLEKKIRLNKEKVFPTPFKHKTATHTVSY